MGSGDILPRIYVARTEVINTIFMPIKLLGWQIDPRASCGGAARY